MDREAWWATVHEVAKRVGYDLATKLNNNKKANIYFIMFDHQQCVRYIGQSSIDPVLTNVEIKAQRFLVLHHYCLQMASRYVSVTVNYALESLE